LTAGIHQIPMLVETYSDTPISVRIWANMEIGS